MLRMADHEGKTLNFFELFWILLNFNELSRILGLLDIYNTVKELRQRRVNMVANLEQYIFLHDALLEAVLCGETGVTAEELGEYF